MMVVARNVIKSGGGGRGHVRDAASLPQFNPTTELDEGNVSFSLPVVFYDEFCPFWLKTNDGHNPPDQDQLFLGHSSRTSRGARFFRLPVRPPLYLSPAYPQTHTHTHICIYIFM